MEGASRRGAPVQMLMQAEAGQCCKDGADAAWATLLTAIGRKKGRAMRLMHRGPRARQAHRLFEKCVSTCATSPRAQQAHVHDKPTCTTTGPRARQAHRLFEKCVSTGAPCMAQQLVSEDGAQAVAGAQKLGLPWQSACVDAACVYLLSMRPNSSGHIV